MLTMRPFQIVLISVFALLALVGLYVFATFSGSNSGPQIGTVVIWGTLPQKPMDAAINTLKSAHKEYAGVSYVQKPTDTFDSDLANALAEGTGPNLVIVNQEELESDAPKLTVIPFSTLSKNTFQSTYLPIDQLYLTSTGTYGIPLVVDPLVLYCNDLLLRAANQATPPTNWSQVTGLVPLITKQSPTQVISVSAIPFGSYDNVKNARAILSLLFLQTFQLLHSPAIVDFGSTGERSVLGDTSKKLGNSLTPAQAAVDFYTGFADQALQIYTWNQSLKESDAMFKAGDLALYPGYASEFSQIATTNPNLQFYMAPMPQATDSNAHITYGLAYAFAIPKVEKNQTGAYNTALSLTGSSLVPTLALSLGMAPAQRALLKSDPANAETAVYYPEALNAQGWLSPAPSKVDEVFSGIISSVKNGHDTLTALGQADLLLNAAF